MTAFSTIRTTFKRKANKMFELSHQIDAIASFLLTSIGTKIYFQVIHV